MDDAELHHMIELLVDDLEAFRCQSPRACGDGRTFGEDVMGNPMCCWLSQRWGVEK